MSSHALLVARRCNSLTAAEGDFALVAMWAACTLSSHFTNVDTEGQTTIFHSSVVPGISLSHYCSLMAYRINLDPSCLSVALVLVQRYWIVSPHRPCVLAVHRLVAAALLVAMKLQHDLVCRNTDVAAACGLRPYELNRLEVALLVALDFDTHVTAADVTRVVGRMVADGAIPKDQRTPADVMATFDLNAPRGSSAKPFPPTQASGRMPRFPHAENLQGAPFTELTAAERNAALETLWAACVHASQHSDVDAPPIAATVFHSSAVPGVSLSAYVTYILRRVTVSRACVSIALVLVQRYWAVSGQRPSALTAHRLMAAALLVAMKVHHDVVWRNSDFAAACALSLHELNRLEVALLVALDFDAHVTAAHVDRVVAQLLVDGKAAADVIETSDDDDDEDASSLCDPSEHIPTPEASVTSRFGSSP